MVKRLINGLFKLVQHLIGALLGPLWTIINGNLPPVIVSSLSYVSYFFIYATRALNWCIDLLCIPPQAIQLLAYYYIFKLTAPILAYGVKLGVKWYHMLAP